MDTNLQPLSDVVTSPDVDAKRGRNLPSETRATENSHDLTGTDWLRWFENKFSFLKRIMSFSAKLEKWPL